MLINLFWFFLLNRISLSSLDSDIEDTFYDARESESPKKRANDKGQSSTADKQQQLTNFTLTRYSSASASRLDDLVNNSESLSGGSQSPESLFGHQTRIAISSTDIVLNSSSSPSGSPESQINVIPIEKPRSLSASSSETIFKPNHHNLSSITSQQQQKPQQQSNRISTQSTMSHGCARSMNDIMTSTGTTDRCPSPKSGSNSSSRESISPQSTTTIGQSTVTTSSSNQTKHHHPMNTINPQIINNTHTSASSSSSDSNFLANCRQFLTSTTSKIMPNSTLKSNHQHSPSHHPHPHHPNHHPHQYLTPPRSTLHKSISTPSILAAQEAAEEQSTSRERRDK